jgi:hypothetical protein
LSSSFLALENSYQPGDKKVLATAPKFLAFLVARV